jgi:hypothetical protein
MHKLGSNKKYLREWVMMKPTPRVDPTREVNFYSTKTVPLHPNGFLDFIAQKVSF